MAAITTPTRRPLLHRLRRLLQIGWLRWEIDSAEQWLRQCEKGGILDSRMLRYQRAHLSTLRVRLALWEAS